ncbi:hypothetical protein HAX54_046013 [Datura stramonium]|uniref:Cystatin domain-containing protein n=1 Tax=Datura stramonium TaxID=4076 RepID=A0ABS8SRC6_DATST|nr:hypothetical protein [Datura stramonium]
MAITQLYSRWSSRRRGDRFLLPPRLSLTRRRKRRFTRRLDPITDTKGPSCSEIGKFAVDQHNKESESNLVFKRVVKGEHQVVAGTHYWLVISAKDGGRRTGNDFKKFIEWCK